MPRIDRDAVAKLTKAQILDQLDVEDSELDDFHQARVRAQELGFDRDKLMNRTKVQMLDDVDAILVDQQVTHRRRLRAQAASLMNLMAGHTYEQEMAALHERVVDLDRRLASAQQELKLLRGEPTSATFSAVLGAS